MNEVVHRKCSQCDEKTTNVVGKLFSDEIIPLCDKCYEKEFRGPHSLHALAERVAINVDKAFHPFEF